MHRYLQYNRAMTIGLLLPSLLMAERFSERIFAPKDLFLSLADGLVDRGHEVYVYSTSNTKTKAHVVSGPELFEQSSVPSIRVRTQADDYTLFKLNYTEYELDLTVKAYQHARELGVSIMHSYHDHLAHYIASLSTIPTVYTLHDPAFDEHTLEGWRFDRFKKDRYIAISYRQKELFQSRLNVIGVVYHGIDTVQWEYSVGEGEYLAYGGRFIPEKGVEDALSASETLNIPLHLATSENYLDTPYYKDNLAARVKNSLFTFTGFLSAKAKNDWLKRARALLFPIKWEEPFGIVMIEAMACGTPVIAYRRGSVPEVVKDGITGFIVDDIGGMVNAIRRIGQIDRSACRKHVEENFTVEKMVKGYEEVYGRIQKSGV